MTAPVLFTLSVVIIGLCATPIALANDKGYGVYTARLHNLIGNILYVPYIAYILTNIVSIGARAGITQESGHNYVQFGVATEAAIAFGLCVLGILSKFLVLKCLSFKFPEVYYNATPLAPVIPHWLNEGKETIGSGALSDYDPETQQLMNEASRNARKLRAEMRKDTVGNILGTRLGFDLSGHSSAHNTNTLSALYLLFWSCVLSLILNLMYVTDELGTFMANELTISLGSILLWAFIRHFRESLDQLSNALDYNPASGIGFEISIRTPKFKDSEFGCHVRVTPAVRDSDNVELLNIFPGTKQ